MKNNERKPRITKGKEGVFGEKERIDEKLEGWIKTNENGRKANESERERAVLKTNEKRKNEWARMSRKMKVK